MLNQKIKAKIIFIGGIHGVGKGTLCGKLKERYTIPHFSSSDLLKWNEISSKENKLVENFQSTQERLINGIEKKISPKILTLLDGHFCLLNKLGIPEKIAIETFLQINPIAIAVVTENIKIVKKRLESRDSKLYSAETLSEMQSMEIDYGLKISKKLNIPFFETGNKFQKNIGEFISKHI